VRPRDIRSSRPFFLTRTPWRALLRRSFGIASLVFIDLCGVSLGLYGALVVRELYVGHTSPLWGLLWEAETKWLPFLMLITVLVFWHSGLYGPRERRAGFGRVLGSVVAVALLTVAFALGSGHRFSTFLLVPTAVLLSAAAIGVFRASYDAATGELMRLAGVRRRTLLVGDSGELAHLKAVLGGSSAGIAYEFVGALTDRADDLDVKVLGTREDLGRVLARRAVDEILVADTELGEAELLEITEVAHRRGVKVRVAPKTTELLARRAEYIPGQGVPLFELRPPAFAGTDWVVKRAFDTIVSASVLVLGLPLWLLIAGAVKLTSKGSVLYVDRRIGVNESEFPMLKFRTMYSDAAARQDELEEVNEADGALFKLRRDPRVTPVGAWLRRLSLDEVPQLLNVLRGEMSLVGPRPLPLRDYKKLEDWHRTRYLVLPGITGLWQVSGRSSLSFDDLVRLDFYYLENWSLWLDVSIILRTIPAVLAGRGAY
jgi:exopolysaccharide biosynthesis polyprenyl glycosylphosphotransferase